MRRFLFIILAGIIYFVGIPICCAQDLIPEISPSQAHMQLVNQALDRIEYSGNNQMVVSPPARNNQPIQTTVPLSDSHLVPKKNEFSFSSELYSAKYYQPKISNQNGFMSGYNAQFTHRINDGPDVFINVFRLQAQWAGGKFKTEPVDQGPSGIKVGTYDIRGVIGKDSYTIAHVRATGYFGFGYRYWKDISEGLDTDLGGFTLLGYNKYLHYCYIPVGADLVYQNSPYYTIESNLEYDYLVNGWQVDKLGVLPGYDTIIFNPRSGNGLRASLRLNLYFKYCTAFVEGFYRYWNIAKSNTKTDPTDPTVGLNEPKNSTQEFGLRLGVQI